MVDKKRRHHYVWQHYLKSWVGADGKLAYRRADSCKRANTKAIAFRRDFYRLQDIPDDLTNLIERLIGKMDEPARSLARGWTPCFRAVFALERVYLARGKKDERFEREIEVAKSNLEEDLHGHFEQQGVEPLAVLRRMDATPLLADDSPEFWVFLLLQYFRTPAIVSRVSKEVLDLGIDVSPALGLLRTVFATSVAAGLYRERKSLRIQFLRPRGDSEFIAGDQPMINLAGPDQLDLYYPLGPKLAVRITPESANPGAAVVTLSDDEVGTYNRRIADASEEQTYATSEAVLLALGA